MNLDQLKHLVTVCDNRSINLASKELYLSQQGLSISIHNLEQELGAKLLVRTNRGVFPTEIGMKVYYYAKRVIQDFNKIVIEAKSLNNVQKYINVQGSIRTKSTKNFLRTFMPFFSLHIITNFPNLKSEGTIDNFENVIQALINKSIDFAFVNLAYIDSPDEILLPKNRFVFIPLFKCGIYVWVSEASPLAKRCALTFEDIKNTKVVMESNADIFLYKTIFKQNYDELLKNTAFYNYPEVTSEFVVVNKAVLLDIKMDGYGFCYEDLFQNKAVSCVPLLLEEPDCQIYGGYLVHKDTDKLPIIESLTEFIKFG